MKKIILIFGLIIGLLLSTNAITHMSMMYSNPDYKGNDALGYATLVIIFSLIYFGVRRYRNNHLDGKISFGNAFKLGALICFIASTVYTILGLGYYYIFAPDFLEVFTEVVLRNTPSEEVEATAEQMANFKEMYKNPLFAIFVTYLEVLPIGMVVALVSAFVVKEN